MIRESDRISPAYRDQQIWLHVQPQGYGGKGSRWADTVLAICREYRCVSVLDYGCGQGTLVQALRRKDPRIGYREYDPAISEKSAAPLFADLVVCTDVLEHIEPDKLENVLKHIHMLARKAVFLVVSTRPANKTLRDGRNAHLIVQPGEWWSAQVQAVGFQTGRLPDVAPAKKPGKAWLAVLETQERER